jgi:hypothetical protein
MAFDWVVTSGSKVGAGSMGPTILASVGASIGSAATAATVVAVIVAAIRGGAGAIVAWIGKTSEDRKMQLGRYEYAFDMPSMSHFTRIACTLFNSTFIPQIHPPLIPKSWDLNFGAVLQLHFAPALRTGIQSQHPM